MIVNLTKRAKEKRFYSNDIIFSDEFSTGGFDKDNALFKLRKIESVGNNTVKIKKLVKSDDGLLTWQQSCIYERMRSVTQTVKKFCHIHKYDIKKVKKANLKIKEIDINLED